MKKEERVLVRKTHHGMYKFPEYKTYSDMLQRCRDKNDIGYHRYGGRGISVCKSWEESFENFYKDMGPRPEGYTLDRINNDGNYEPGNCRWASKEEQDNNRSDNHYITYKERTQSMSQWSREMGINIQTLKSRIEHKWDIENLFLLPKKGKKITFKGESKTVKEWAKELGISKYVIWERLKKGLEIDRVLSPEIRGNNCLMEYKGKLKNIREWASDYGFKISTVKKRIELGWTLEKSLTTPVLKMRKKE